MMIIDQIYALIINNKLTSILLILLTVSFLIELVFYCRYYLYSHWEKTKATKSKTINKSESQPKVTIIITTSDKIQYLCQNLTAFLEQDYPNFEVIVVNNGYADDFESEFILQRLLEQYSNFYYTKLPYSEESAFRRRKLALTIGLKAAKNDLVLFSEAFCRPISNQWISSMVKSLKNDIEAVIGYSYISIQPSIKNKFAQFDNHLFSCRFLSMASKGKPFYGSYRNILFKKELFFNNKGFARYLNFDAGEDLFLNKILSESKVGVALLKDSFTEMYIGEYPLWKILKERYFLAYRHYEHKCRRFYTEILSKYIFYILFIIVLIIGISECECIVYSFCLLLFFSKLLSQLLIVNKSSKYLRNGKFYFTFLLFDLIHPIYIIRLKTNRKK